MLLRWGVPQLDGNLPSLSGALAHCVQRTLLRAWVGGGRFVAASSISVMGAV